MPYYFKQLICTIILILSPQFAWAMVTEHQHRDQVIAEVEAYLNGIQSYRANFIQESGGQINRKGSLYIQKPDKIRLDYLTPDNETIIVDQDFITHYNPDLDAVNFMENDNIPLSFLSRQHITLGQDIKVGDIVEDGTYLTIQFILPYKDLDHVVYMTFGNNPFEMHGIRILDDGGESVQLNITDAKKNLHINPGLFEIKRKEKYRY